ncbi:carboxypeptidase-like regulatory domain-containing protein [Algoriphagus aestuarii]|nr:carboxypeptidase-like regulatory domain-containing protein [Algoriphagus aestuarii]
MIRIPRPKSLVFSMILALFIFYPLFSSFAQQTLKGRVLEYGTEVPVPFASIYLTNTTLGVTADENGSFNLSIPDGSYNVLIRMLGYESVTFSINTNQLPVKGFQVQLDPSDQELEEIDVEEERDPVWYKNLETFKTYFFGTTKNGRAIILKNEKSLLLDRDSNPDILQVSAKEALKFDNPNLGYSLEFLLVQFQYNFKAGTILYKGYPLFIPYENVKSSKAKKIEKNRDSAYKGSLQHFIHSLYVGYSQDEGYIIRRMLKIPNPEKPSKTQMEEAKQIFKSSKSIELKDSLQIHVLSKSTMPDSIIILDQNELDPEVLLERNTENGRVFLKSKDQLHITYTKEPMAREYLGSSTLPPKTSNQISKIKVADEGVELFFSGSFEDPLGILVEDYMAWERVGDLMPYDYVPIREK